MDFRRRILLACFVYLLLPLSVAFAVNKYGAVTVHYDQFVKKDPKVIINNLLVLQTSTVNAAQQCYKHCSKNSLCEGFFLAKKFSQMDNCRLIQGNLETNYLNLTYSTDYYFYEKMSYCTKNPGICKNGSKCRPYYNNGSFVCEWCSYPNYGTYCNETRQQIIDPDNKFCVEPQSGGCSVADNTSIVLRSTNTRCNNTESDFIFDPNTGELTHKCSGKSVCTLNGGIASETNVVISSTCPKMTQDLRFVRTLWSAIQFGNLFWRPSTNTLADNTVINLYGGGMAVTRRFVFPSLAKGAVRASYFNSLTNSLDALLNDPRYPNTPTNAGQIDNLDAAKDVADYYGTSLTTYFVAPQTGGYKFVTSCDSQCKVFLSGDTNRANKQQIIYQQGYTSYHQWNIRSDQASSVIELIAGKKYYLEAISVEGIGGDHLSVGVYLPDGKALLPITGNYLAEYED